MQKIGCDTRTWVVHRTSTKQLSGRWAGDPTSQGSRWTDSKEGSGSCSSKYPLTRRIAVKNQAAKYQINICFLEPSDFEGIVVEAQAWKKFINDQVGPSS